MHISLSIHIATNVQNVDRLSVYNILLWTIPPQLTAAHNKSTPIIMDIRWRPQVHNSDCRRWTTYERTTYVLQNLQFNNKTWCTTYIVGTLRICIYTKRYIVEQQLLNTTRCINMIFGLFSIRLDLLPAPHAIASRMRCVLGRYQKSK